MGVLGLWKLIEQSGKPVPLETLENKVLAVDISIWLHQVTKGFQDSKGSALPNAHVLGLFHRLCKLMYYRIKPIFVFDGGVPLLKKQTIAKRNQNKNNYQNEADRIQQLLLETLAKEKVVQQALGSATNILISPAKKPTSSGAAGTSKQDREEEPDSIFKLPPMKAPEEPIDLDRSDEMDEKSSRNYYHLNLNAIDVSSIYFKNLPADVRHDILNDIKETRKQSSWGRLHELPVESNSFSSFQMKRLLKRRQVQVEIEEAEKEMGGKCLSLAELESLLNEEGVETTSSKAAQQIASDENTRFLLVRDVQKAMEKAKAREEAERLAPKAPKVAKLSTEKQGEMDDKEMDEELQLAIKMSLMQDETPHAVVELDEEDLRMSRKQKQALGNAAQSLARGFMLEYGGLTSEEFNELLHQTQDVDVGDIDDSMSQMYVHNDSSVAQHPLATIHEISDDEADVAEETENATKASSASDTESDSDFIDVPEDNLNDSIQGISMPLNSTNHFKPHFNPIVDFTLEDIKQLSGKVPPSKRKDALEVLIKPEDMGVCEEDDIFADVFTDMKSNTIKHEVARNVPSNEHQTSVTNVAVPEVNVVEREEKNDAETIVEKPAIEFKGLKIKKVQDINAQLKEELENLKKAPPVIDLNDILVDSRLPGMAETSVDLQDISDTLKQELELLKSKAIQLDVQLEANTKNPLESVGIDDNDSDATIIYDADDVESPIKKAQPDQVEKVEESGSSLKRDEPEVTAAPVIEIVDSPAKKGTLEHMIVARTPGKDSQKDSPAESVPYVTKPFFVNKTSPGSSPSLSNKATHRKEGEEASCSVKSVAKELFPAVVESEPTPSTSKQTVQPDPKPVSAEHLISEMADSLKESRTPAELKRMALDLAQSERELEREKNKQSRLAMSITERMRDDCMELLRIFGVPYIVAPMEAEAQCAFLNQIEMTDGTITDDSDIWLFGGRKVYKNFFNQQKLVLEYTSESIEHMFQMDRKKLIQLALLVGSDYTTGIHGIGAVTALEILASFPSTPEHPGETSEIMSLLSGLRKFRDWWQHGRNSAVGTRIALKSKLKNIDISEGFPSTTVVEAYLQPTVDYSEEEFTWGYPDADRLRDYARHMFGWTPVKTNDLLLPVLKRLDERKSQASIKNYFKVQSAVGHNRPKVSKRVQHAVDTMAGKVDPEEKPKKSKPKQPGTRKRKPAAKKTDETVDLVQIGEAEEKLASKGDDEATVTWNSVGEEDDFVEPKPRNGAGRAKASDGGSSTKPKRSRKKPQAVSLEDPSRKAETAESSTASQRPPHALANIGGIIANINQQSADSMTTDIAERRKRAGNRIPDFNPEIPQRIRDQQEMERRKKAAAEVMRKMKAQGK